MDLTPGERQRIYEEEKAKLELQAELKGPNRQGRLIAAGAGIFVLVISTWLIAQPYFLLGRIRAAAQTGDRDALAQCVDFPALRENMKAYLNAEMSKQMAADLQDNPFAGLGVLLGGALVDRLVESFVTPSGIAMLSEGQRPNQTQEDPSQEQSDRGKVNASQGYRSLSVFHVRVWPDTNRAAAVTFVLHRRGLGWMLTDIRLPGADASALAGISDRPEDIRATAGIATEQLEKASVGRRTEAGSENNDRGAESAEGMSRAETRVSWGNAERQPTPSPPPADEELPKFGEYVYVEELPEAIAKVSPRYPDEAREAGVDGQVVVQALVGKDGRVKDTRVVRSVPMLDAAAVTAVEQWVFKPAMTRNEPVAVWVAVPVRFSLR